MIDQSKVTSGFDVEFLMGERFIQAFLLTSLETGSIPWWTESSGTTGTPPAPYRTATIIHPPEALRAMRRYPVFAEFADHEHPFVDVAAAYSTQSDELTVTILDGDPRGADVEVRVYPTVLDLMTVPPLVRIGNVLPIELALSFNVVSTTRPDGLLGDIGIALSLVDVSGALIEAIEQLLAQPDPPPLPTKADILTQLRETIDRTVPFAVSGGGALQRIRTRTFAADADHAAAIGVYIDLALRSGPAPSDFLTTVRGDTALAQNSLERGGAMAFALPATTYALLSDDLTFKMARPRDDDPTTYHYPIMDGDDRIGTIHSVTVRPDRIASSGVYTNALVVDVSGEYEVENWFDPDFHLRISLRPRVDSAGVLDFDVDLDLDLSATATLVSLFVGLAVSFLLPQLGIPLLMLTVIALKAVEHYGAQSAGSTLTEQGAVTSFLDTLPHKLTVETHRWDPLYSTDHRIEVADASVVVDDNGFAMDAASVLVGRRTRPLGSMVVRDATRAPDGTVRGLVYRANDLGRFLSTDIRAIAAAVDRMPYERLLPAVGVESHRVELTLAQVQARIGAGERHVADIDYRPEKVHVVAHQISRILAASQREIDESPDLARGLLRAEYRAQHAASLRTDAVAQLVAELGRTPTEDEIRARIEGIVVAATEPGVPGRARAELLRRLTFDLRPREFAALQRAGILTLGRDWLEIRESPRGTLYYRDYERPFEPGTPTWDNLVSLPRYSPAAE
jgi:hypothetical protein